MATKLSPAKVRAMVKNPGTRSKVPTSQLPAKYRAMRASNQRRAAANDPEALTAPLTPATLDARVAADTALYAAPAERELAGQRAVHGQMQAAVPVWYQDYRNSLAQATQRTQQAYGAALGVQQNVANTTSALDAQQGAQLQQGMQADAAARGASVDPSIAATAQQAATSRRAQMDAQQGLTAGLGAAQTGYRAGQEIVGAGQQLSASLDEAARGRNLDKAGDKLAVQKGQFATETRQKLIDAEHTKQLERKAFGLSVEKAKADADRDAKQLQLDQEKLTAQQALNDAKLTNDQARIAIAQGNLDVARNRASTYATSTANAGKAKVRKPTAATGAARKDVSFALSHIPKLLKHRPPQQTKDKKTGKVTMKTDDQGKPIPGNRTLTRGEVRDLLETGKIGGRKIPHDAVNAALKLLEPNGGYLDAAQIRGLRAAYPGIRIGSLGYPTANSRKGKAKAKAKAKPKPKPKAMAYDPNATPLSQTRP